MFIYIILAVLQGLFEWLPISSSGQTMIIAMNVFSISADEAFSLAIWLHLGTMLAVFFRFIKDYWNIFKACLPPIFKDIEEVEKKKRNWLIFATIGTAITALPLYFIFREVIIEILLVSEADAAFVGDIITLIISGLLIITGIILLMTQKKEGKRKIEDVPMGKINKQSFLAGLAQGISILPGISRSGITVSTILGQKYEQNNALKLSFLMSVPVVIASVAVDLIFGEGSIFALDPFIIILVIIVSFLVGYLTIEVLIRVSKKVNFGYFCIFYGVIAFLVITPFLIYSILV
ncbi:MAG: undecaprenyl-diphosphate phosphatase [Promethearchaeota archaeon]|nr:MAG: undecaprenyl-diphosphate phosphatase [Candidatus Lokiarchaeota archaeon]